MTQIILITGKKQSGKSTSVDYCMDQIAKHYGCNIHASMAISLSHLTLNGELMAKHYSFADPLKRFLIDVLGLKEEQCYGTDEEKNSPTKIKWGDLPFGDDEIIEHFVKSKGIKDKSITDSYIESKYLHKDIAGTYLTGREIMQLFGTNICRRMSSDCWAIGTLNRILQEKPQYAFIADARFPNEIDVFLPYDPIVVRLFRSPFHSDHISETALDNYNWNKCGNKIIFLHNEEMSVDVKNKWVWDGIKELL